MQKYHIQIQIHPIEGDSINDKESYFSLMTQGKGFDTNEVAKILSKLARKLKKEGVDFVNTGLQKEPF